MRLRNKELSPVRVFREGGRLLQVSLSEDAVSMMVRYIELLRQWGKRTNLTSLTDPVEIAVRHFLDSMTAFKVLPVTFGLRILDIGTGAGFPGMVMKIADQSLHMTLLDKNPKKIVFLKHVARELGLSGIQFVNMDLQHFLTSERFQPAQVVIFRALAVEPAFMDSVRASLCSGGSLICMLGPLNGLPDHVGRGFRRQEVWEGSLPFSDRYRRVHRYVLAPDL